MLFIELVQILQDEAKVKLDHQISIIYTPHIYILLQLHSVGSTFTISVDIIVRVWKPSEKRICERISSIPCSCGGCGAIRISRIGRKSHQLPHQFSSWANNCCGEERQHLGRCFVAIPPSGWLHCWFLPWSLQNHPVVISDISCGKLIFI